MKAMNTSEPNQDGELTGRELDIAMAEQVMKWPVYRSPFTGTELRSQTWGYVCVLDEGTVMLDYATSRRRTWSPSSSIADAMEILPALRKRLALSDSIVCWCKPNSFIVQIWADDADDTELANVLADTLPEAICKAALATMETKQ